MPDQTFVLVAEDEELVRLVIVQVLLDEGFEVMEAEHAEAALIVLESHARPPDHATFPKESRFVAKPYRHRHVIRHIRELAEA